MSVGHCPQSPASRASSPASLPRSPCFHSPCHTRQWQARSGRSGNRAESESHGAPLFPLSDWVLDCSEPPLYCGIAAPCLRRPDPQGRPLASASCRLKGCPAIPRHPNSPYPPIASSSSILQFKMAAAAAAAAAMAPPGCPGSCPNFAVVCSFLERYGPLLDLPELPFPELERVLQAPPPDVGNGEGKRGGPNARREAALVCSFSLLPTDTPGLRGSVLPLRRSSARPVSSAQPPGVSGSGEAGRRPRRANSARRPAEVGASSSRSGRGG